MNKPVIVVGGGGHAAVLIDSLKLLGKEIIGIVDPALPVGSLGPGGVNVLGDDDQILDYSPEKIELVNGIGSLPRGKIRGKKFRSLESKGYIFSSVIHPSAIVSKTAIVSSGVQIMAGVVIQTGTTIGKNTIINTKVAIDHDCVIGKHCHVAPGVTVSGNVIVKDRVHIGTGASVIESVTIGQDVVIGAGAVVTKDIKDNIMVYSARGSQKVIIGNEL